MKKDAKYDSIVNVWAKFTKDIDPGRATLEVTLYKKLLSFFQVGEYCFMVLNFSTLELDYVSPSIEKILGYRTDEVNIKFYFDLIHPEDQIWFGNFEHEASKFLPTLSHKQLFDYKIQYDLRFRMKDGTYRRLLHQSLTIQQYEEGGIFRTLSLYTDITHLKPVGKPMLSFIGLNGEPSYINVQLGKPLIPFEDVLSKREKEVLRLMIEGKQNKEIAQILNISKLTVDKHRNNMLRRNNLKNSSELIGEAIRNGWIYV